MWLLPLITVSIAIRLNGAKKYHINEDSIPRYVIPHPEERQRSAFLPEAVVKKSGSIVGTELPGAYGEDFELESAFESGSGASGSGSSGDKADVIFVARSGEDLETAGKFGNNDVSVANNPVTAFTSEEDDEDVEAEKSQADSKSKKTKASKTDNSAPTVKDATEKQAKTSKSEETKKTAKVEKSEKTKKHKSSTKKTKAKAKSNVSPSSDENNMISKIDAIARQIERVEHKEKLDRKEEATLKVAKKVAKKVIKDIAAKKQKAKIVKEVSKMIEKPEVKPAPSARKENTAAPEVKVKQVCPISNPYAYRGGSRCCHINQDKQGHPLSLASESCDSDHDEECPTERCTDNKSFVGPEGFECPWACFWSCHSYCPKECCHNPYKCDLVCREICTPYCSDRCCAPGSKRLPKLQITFPANEGNNITAVNKEVVKPFNGTFIDNAENAKFNPAESSYQLEKEHEEKIEYERQMDVLKKAASYAASQIGLPSECPLACARICIPGLCKSECCRSSIPNPVQKYQSKMPLGPFNSAAVQPASSIAAALPTHYGPQLQSVPTALRPLPYTSGATKIAKAPVNPALNRFALAKKMAATQKPNPFLMPNKPRMPVSAAFRRPPANNYALNKLALQNQYLQGKAAVAQYRAMAFANQVNTKNALLANSLKSIASPASAIAAVCPFPSPSCQNPFVPPLIHNCAPVCRSSCIPTCPNECCVI